MARPLEGIRILEVGHSRACAVCTQLLSDFGADVIHIAPFADDVGPPGPYSRGKKRLHLALEEPEQRRQIFRLAATAAAVVAASPDEILETLGVTELFLRSANKALVYTTVSAFGQGGPCGGRLAGDAEIQAEAGLMSITGEVDGEPLLCGGPIADYVGGLSGCIGTLIGILDAQRTGVGGQVDVSAMDALILCLENQFSGYLRTGEIPHPQGNSYELAAPVGLYRCGDKQSIMLSLASDLQWEKFVRALGQNGWLERPEYASMKDRIRNAEMLDREISCVLEKYDRATLAELLQAAGCVYGTVNDLEGVLRHPQVVNRGTMVETYFRDGTMYPLPGAPIRMSGLRRRRAFLAERSVTAEEIALQL